MKNLRSIGLIWVICLLAALVFCSCGGKHRAKKTAKTFLEAYYMELDFEKARGLATEPSFEIINNKKELSALNPYAKEEVPEVEIKELKLDKENGDKAVCIYNVNRATKTLHLVKEKGIWRADLAEERRERDADMIHLPSSGDGGFASAASGPIKYKKRRQSK